jgi:hypothetical protein
MVRKVAVITMCAGSLAEALAKLRGNAAAAGEAR